MTASLFGLVTFIVGALVGFAVYHYFFRHSNQEKHLLEELEQAKNNFKSYHQQVSQNLTESAILVDQVQENSKKLHDHILNATVALNRNHHKQSFLQPVLHVESGDHDSDDEQVTEYHPAQATPSKVAMVQPRDYV